MSRERAVREYRYTVDRDGRIFHDGTEIVDAAALALFMRLMTRTSEGRYLAVCQGEHNWFDAGDTPLVIQRVRWPEGDADALAIELVFAGDHRERLDPDALESEDGRLYCRIRRGQLRARFGRIALQQLAPFLADDGEPALIRSGIRHPIRIVDGR